MRHIEQYLRCYTEYQGGAANRPLPGRTDAGDKEGDESTAIAECVRPYGGYVFVLDCETTMDAAQRLRFGVYAVYGISRDEQLRAYRDGTLTRELLDSECTRGVFYDLAAFLDQDVLAIQTWARQRRCDCLTVDAFIDQVFYPWVMRYQALCVGHNLPFDLTRLATHWGAIDRGSYAGGFWMSLCRCRHAATGKCFRHRTIRLKRLGYPKTRISFRTATLRQRDGTIVKKQYRGKFLDTMTFGRALLGSEGSLSLDGLGKRAGARIIKARWTGEHGSGISAEYLDYCARDVSATFSLYQALRDLYRKHGVSTPMWGIYSEASLGKAYLGDLGVPRFLRQHPSLPKEIIGYAMQAYYGGRSEVHIRLQPTEVLYCDFKSQYPTVNALMDLQSLLLAERIDVRNCTAEIGDWLASLELAELQRHEAWRKLRVLVKVRPSGDILPVRGAWGDGPAATNIAMPLIVRGLDTWYTLADVIASTLLTDKLPEIVEAVEIVPVGRVQTNPWALFGDERYPIDLASQDFFATVIAMRIAIKAEMQGTTRDDPNYEYFDSVQLALKLLANSTAYGALVEINQSERTEDTKRLRVYDDTTYEANVHTIETPGRYFAGCVGTFIPAAGRLLLAIAERLAADRGMAHAFCDTDSMAFARPDGMDRTAFGRRVQEIVEWFTPLSPYADGLPIFERQDQNDWQGHAEPLYFLGVSAKRYALYNRLPDGTFRIRKFSSHGTGRYSVRHAQEGREQLLEDVYQPRTDVPPPCEDTYRLGGPRWLYDLWYHAMTQVDQGQTWVTLDEAEWLRSPARTQVTITTRTVYDQYRRHLPDLRPFNFITVYPPIDRATETRRLLTDTEAVDDQEDDDAPDSGDAEIVRMEWQALRRRVLAVGGIRPNADYQAADIPPSLIRRAGASADVVALHLDYANDVVLLEDAWRRYRRARHATRPTRARRPTPTSYYDSPEGVRRLDTHALAVVTRMEWLDGPQPYERIRTTVTEPLPMKRLRECLRDYFRHPERKAANPRGVGLLERPTVVIVGQVSIGKESNEVAQEIVDDGGTVVGYEDAQQFGRSGIRQALRHHGIGNVARTMARVGGRRSTGPELGISIPEHTLRDYADGTCLPSRSARRRLLAALDACEPVTGCCADESANGTELLEQIRTVGVRAVAHRAGIPVSTLGMIMCGKRHPGKALLARIHAALEAGVVAISLSN